VIYGVAQRYVCSGNLIVFNQNSFVCIKLLHFTFVSFCTKTKNCEFAVYCNASTYIYIHTYLRTCASNVNAQAVACAHVFAS
jgi:hypothetical protein